MAWRRRCLLVNLPPFVSAFVGGVDEAMRAHQPQLRPVRMIQRTWLAYVVPAVLVTNSITPGHAGNGATSAHIRWLRCRGCSGTARCPGSHSCGQGARHSHGTMAHPRESVTMT